MVGKVFLWVLGLVAMAVVMAGIFVFTGNKIKFVSLKPEIKWEQDRVAVRELSTLYGFEQAELRRVIVVLHAEFKTFAGSGIGRSPEEIVYYARSEQIGKTILVHVYLDEEEYARTQEGMRNQMVRYAVKLGATSSTNVSCCSTREVYLERYSSNRSTACGRFFRPSPTRK